MLGGRLATGDVEARARDVLGEKANHIAPEEMIET